MNVQNNNRKLVPVSKWQEHHHWPPIGGLRYLIFHGKTNGFDACLVRVGKRILIDEAKFFEWVDKNNHLPNLPVNAAQAEYISKSNDQNAALITTA